MGDVIGTLMSQIGSKSEGVKGLISKLSEGGLAKQVESWIGHGENAPVSPDQVKQALGEQKISQLAQQAGTTPDDAAGQLAQHLPNMVDKLTPQGVLPQGDAIKDKVGKLFSKS